MTTAAAKPNSKDKKDQVSPAKTTEPAIVLKLDFYSELLHLISLIERAASSGTHSGDSRLAARALRALPAVRRRTGTLALQSFLNDRLVSDSDIHAQITSIIKKSDPALHGGDSVTPAKSLQSVLQAAAAATAATAAGDAAAKDKDKDKDVEMKSAEGPGTGTSATTPSAGTAPGTTPTKDKESKQVTHVVHAPPHVSGTAESSLFIGLVALVFLLDKNRSEEAGWLSELLLAKCASLPLRSMDPLYAKIVFYRARALEATQNQTSIRAPFFSLLRVATERHLDETRSVCLNELLRAFISARSFDTAEQLATLAASQASGTGIASARDAKSGTANGGPVDLPSASPGNSTQSNDTPMLALPAAASGPQHARFHFYVGRIRAILLDYSDALRHLNLAARRAPQIQIAAGFQQHVAKFHVVVQLLMGEIPERSLFCEQFLSRPLVPYFQLTQAVRTGDMRLFRETLAKYSHLFTADGTMTLIRRLHHTVIKAGLRVLASAYTRIPLELVAKKLGLVTADASAADLAAARDNVEAIVARAIRDNVIAAEIDHEGGFLQTKDEVNNYTTNKTKHVYRQRVDYYMALYNASVKALRFPDESSKDTDEVDPEKEEERRAKDQLVNRLSYPHDMDTDDEDDVLLDEDDESDF
ncbi:hypothetical protein H696_04454 [Fonticula alba]|uniref:PCI domain-containing protein n=1 Tax=Fonticula alba TaxID=691883 RepID=A0A058Z436_FONAL|nr:hypothetical protein H696_04454 [Fonticula alba]KCV69034.1 hypothetical protein H696_04454 [Fonticula alba]|eukprot:XP_009496605.1 hypothetical protein H696_04454 [Fonticula alba]